MRKLNGIVGIFGRRTVESVTLELGRDEAEISVTAYAGDRLRLALGSSHEFAGTYHDLPLGIATAARRVLEVAGSCVDRLPRVSAADASVPGAVRFVVRTTRATYAGEALLGELNGGRSPLAALWRAFSDMMGHAIVALFPSPRATPSTQASPGLVRARRLWPAPRTHRLDDSRIRFRDFGA